MDMPHSSRITTRELCAIAAEAASRGTSILRTDAASRTPVRKGAPGDVVTEVDRQVEASIREFLREVRPDDRVVGEELPDTGTATTGIEWYLDPIDGTTNFVHGLDLYCTSVAAYDATGGVWLAGAVAVPAGGVMYSAASGHGARKTLPDGTFVQLDASGPSGAPRLLGVGLSYDAEARAGQFDDIRARMNDYDDLRSLGTAAYALCLVADGVLASFVETDLFVYDWAAGALIAEEAGATVTRPATGRGPVSAHGRH
ncbi:inositol monophosphatase family protein [Streptomyces sp. NPDC056716]|uniref:inositol monophosphatase family protein n=1 Tax=unclassified Streptomyces TaxID=2593676 RepID=UPI0036B303E6